jgi:hypothetical protein
MSLNIAQRVSALAQRVAKHDREAMPGATGEINFQRSIDANRRYSSVPVVQFAAELATGMYEHGRREGASKTASAIGAAILTVGSAPLLPLMMAYAARNRAEVGLYTVAQQVEGHEG